MAKKVLTALDLTRNEIQNAVAQNLATDPSTPKPGQFWFSTADNYIHYAGGSGVVVVGGWELSANKGQPNGYAGLDSGGKVPLSQLPSSVTAQSAIGKYTASVGDGTSTSFTITQATHGRGAGLTNVVAVYDASSGANVFCDATFNAAGDLTLAFGTAPTANQYKVVIIG